MATLKQRHKQELKQLNQECDVRIQGKKGAERLAEMKIIDQMKRALFEKHELELQQEAEAAATEKEQEPPSTADDDAPAPTKQEPKLSKARLKQIRKEEREQEEKQKRNTEAQSKGPTIRDLEMIALTKQIKALGLQVKEITPDGNCLYSAVANQIHVVVNGGAGKLESTDELRYLAAQQMETNRDQFEPFLPETEASFDEYVDKVRQNGEWGGELELRALSMALQKPIWVHRVNSPIVKMGQEFAHEQPVLHVTFHEHQFAMGEHYNSAVPQQQQE